MAFNPTTHEEVRAAVEGLLEGGGQTYDNASPGTRITMIWDGTGFIDPITGVVATARPSLRSDIYFDLIGGDSGDDPAWMQNGDARETIANPAVRWYALPTLYRDPWDQPFADNSIWNTPIGSGAVRVNAGLAPALFHASDLVVVDPIFIGVNNADPTKTLLRNDTTDPTVYVPATMSHNGSWNGIAVFRSPDGNYYEGQPMTLSAGGNPSWSFSRPTTGDTRGPGLTGSHGGSRLSGFGGTIRKWEWDDTGPIQHALAINLYGRRFLSTNTSGFRWPATHADTNYNVDLYPGNTGINQAPSGNGTDNWYGRTGTGFDGMKMGTLLCLPASYNVAAITNSQARRVATALRDFGAYIMDNTTRDVHALSVEQTAESGWNSAGATFHSELMTAISALQYVDNNTSSTIGGGGTPIAAPPPPIAPV